LRRRLQGLLHRGPGGSRMPLVGLVLEGLGLPPPRNGVRCGALWERGEISLEAV